MIDNIVDMTLLFRGSSIRRRILFVKRILVLVLVYTHIVVVDPPARNRPKEAGVQAMSRQTKIAYKAQSPGKLAQHNEAQGSGDRVNAAVVWPQFTFLSGETCSACRFS